MIRRRRRGRIGRLASIHTRNAARPTRQSQSRTSHFRGPCLVRRPGLATAPAAAAAATALGASSLRPKRIRLRAAAFDVLSGKPSIEGGERLYLVAVPDGCIAFSPPALQLPNQLTSMIARGGRGAVGRRPCDRPPFAPVDDEDVEASEGSSSSVASPQSRPCKSSSRRSASASIDVVVVVGPAAIA